MDAMAALAPALGADAAALVGRAVHAERTREAATRLQAAWRGRQAWLYLRRAAARLCMGRLAHGLAPKSYYCMESLAPAGSPGNSWSSL